MMRTHARKKDLQDSSYTSAKSRFNPRPFARPMAEQEVNNLKAVNIQDQLRQLFEKQDLFSLVQPKLIESKAGDKYEKEADRVSEQVMRMLKPNIQHHAEVKGEIQRKPVQLPQVNSRMRVVSDQDAFIPSGGSSGRELPGKLQGTMNQAFGVDFSGVRVYADAESDRLNRSLHARAFTVGQDIFFRKGEYDAQSNQGQKLLSHELTHVVQQTGGRKRSPSLGRGVNKAEQESDVPTVMSQIKAAPYPSIQRSPDIVDPWTGETTPTTPEIVDPWAPCSVRWEIYYNQVVSRRDQRTIIRPRYPSDRLIINSLYMRPDGERDIPVPLSTGSSPTPSGPIELGPISHPRNASGYAHGAITYRTREGTQEAPAIPAASYPVINSNKLIVARVELGAERSEQEYEHRTRREETVSTQERELARERILQTITQQNQAQWVDSVTQTLTDFTERAISRAIETFEGTHHEREVQGGFNAGLNARGFAEVSPSFRVNVGADGINLGQLLALLVGRGSRLASFALGRLLNVDIDIGTETAVQGRAGGELGGQLGLRADIRTLESTDRQRWDRMKTEDVRRRTFATEFRTQSTRSISQTLTDERETTSERGRTSGTERRTGGESSVRGRVQIYENIQPSISFMQILDDPHPPIVPQSGTTTGTASRATQ